MNPLADKELTLAQVFSKEHIPVVEAIIHLIGVIQAGEYCILPSVER